MCKATKYIGLMPFYVPYQTFSQLKGNISCYDSKKQEKYIAY